LEEGLKRALVKKNPTYAVIGFSLFLSPETPRPQQTFAKAITYPAPFFR
jgi:hypothetical protein